MTDVTVEERERLAPISTHFNCPRCSQLGHIEVISNDFIGGGGGAISGK